VFSWYSPKLRCAVCDPTECSATGVLLRSDIHTLFDLGYMTLTTDFHIEVSKRIREEYENGHDYYVLHGRQIALLSREVQYPDLEYIEWHNLNVFRP
jgi:putative restriction endonuclease